MTQRLSRRFLLSLAATLALRNVGADESEEPLEQQVDASLRRALSWLAAAQEPSGAWKTSQHGESTAATSLAVMAFLAGGHVPEEGLYGRNVTRGVGWLLTRQQDNGLLVVKDTGEVPMYAHGISTLMLAEVLGMLDGSQAEEAQRVLSRAVKLIIDAQNVQKGGHHAGGWRYNPASQDSDLSVTGWQLLALRAARDIGCDVPSENIDRAIEYVRRLHVKHDGGFGYSDPNGSTVTRTGTGITALEVCGEHRTPETLAAAQLLLQRPLSSNEGYFYYGAYYCTVGMYKVGGDEWQQIREPLYRTILDRQKPAGYWSPESSERDVGRVYATAMSILALSIEYGYLPIYQR
jgi:hypothetical protein